MRRALLASAIGCFSWLLCLGCVAEQYQDDDSAVMESGEHGVGTSVGLYQAEKFTAQSGCRIATNKTGYTGAGFVDYGGNGTWIEMNNVNVAQAGSYTLKFRFATAAGSRQCALVINGTNVGNVAFSSTGAWTNWGTASITKSLRAGNNTIRIVANTSSGGPNLDSMEVLSNTTAASSCVEAAEHKTAALSCPTGQSIVSVNFASYGVPTGACPGGFATGTCHAASSLDKVKAACLGKQSCSVEASNGVFGDPCAGKAKKLAVAYTCSGGTVIDNCPNDPNKNEPGQCGCGVPEGTCSGGARSNLQVKLNGSWKGVCCNGGELEVSDGNCAWEEGGRVMGTRDLRSGARTELRCPENGQRPADCDCRVPGERMHGIKANGNVQVANSLRLPNGAPIYPNSGHETCIDLVNGELQSRWSNSSCPAWRLVNFY